VIHLMIDLLFSFLYLIYRGRFLVDAILMRLATSFSLLPLIIRLEFYLLWNARAIRVRTSGATLIN
jgi:hypothetical protein